MNRMTPVVIAMLLTWQVYASVAGAEDFAEWYKVFNVKVKPEYLDRKENHTVIKQLSTYFDRENWQVLCRKYRLQHKTALFHFDVLMEIRLEKEGHKYFPEKISYQGDWNIPTKRREIGSFSLDFSEFK